MGLSTAIWWGLHNIELKLPVWGWIHNKTIPWHARTNFKKPIIQLMVQSWDGLDIHFPYKVRPSHACTVCESDTSSGNAYHNIMFTYLLYCNHLVYRMVSTLNLWRQCCVLLNGQSTAPVKTRSTMSTHWHKVYWSTSLFCCSIYTLHSVKLWFVSW